MTASTADAPPRIAAKQRPGDLWFSGTAVFAGSMIVVTLAAVAIFLVIQSLPAFSARELQIEMWPQARTSITGLFGAARSSSSR